ncbi:MAG: sensor histidine kinase [Candidatus Dormibacteria bacterium]
MAPLRRSNPAAIAATAGWLVASAGPPILTLILERSAGSEQRDYVFLYLALVAALGVFCGSGPALLAATGSFLLVDYFFVPPYGTLSIASTQDVVNLVAFVTTAGLIGFLASRRRQALWQARALTAQLRAANDEMVSLNRQQAEAAQAALRLARSEQQVRSLTETDRLRRELLANVSHELRTPLGTILAESTADTTRDTPAAATLERIAREARRLDSLVGDMLSLARIEAGALDLQLEDVDLDDAITSAVERLRDKNPARQVIGPRMGSGVVLADWARLGQILDNLLGNAERHGPPGTPIEIGVAPDSHPGMIAISITDHGTGVDTTLEAHVFDRFLRGAEVDANPSAAPQIGLGLAIVKGLVESHAGTVELLNDPGGATFRFTLPRSET